MIVLDIETTGMEPKRNSLLSMGAVEFEKPSNTFYGECRIDEGAAVNPTALKINGFTLKQITDRSKPASEELIKKFLAWAAKIKDKTLAGDNIWFDIRFMTVYLERMKVKWPFGKRSVELHLLSPLTAALQWDLDIVLQIVGMPPRKGSHNALNDALLEAETISRLVYGKNMVKKFAKFPLPDYMKNGLRP
jgi:DNA polymerase III epsilon subunit-like protein